ncbi:MoaD/ThiS family protein [Chloroflexota bacterium]
MGKVRLKITPSLASIVNAKGSDWFILEKEIGEGTTIGDLFSDLAFHYADFRKVVFNPDSGQVSDEVLVVLNDSLLQVPDVTGVKLNDGDNVILLPVYSGG